MADTRVLPRVVDRISHDWLLASKRIVHQLRSLFGGGKQARKCVFVAGVQRSGTNMMMDVLERSYETDVYHERDTRAFDNYQMRERMVIHQLARRSKAPVFVIKSLCELQDLKSLMDEFSPAKTIWVMRHYEDVVNSMLVSFRHQARQVQRIVSDRKGDGWWLGRGMSDETFGILKELVRPDLDDASAAALQWYLRNTLFFEQGLDTDARVMAVSYEHLVSEPQDQFRKIFGFLGLRYTPHVASTIFATSVKRRVSPAIIQPVRELCDGLNARIAAVIDSSRVVHG